MASHPAVGNGRRAALRVGPLKAVAFVLLLGECLVILVPSVYGRDAPRLAGIPFFYWFQLAWIIVGMIVTGIAYLLWQRAERPPPHAGTNGPGGDQ